MRHMCAQLKSTHAPRSSEPSRAIRAVLESLTESISELARLFALPQLLNVLAENETSRAKAGEIGKEAPNFRLVESARRDWYSISSAFLVAEAASAETFSDNVANASAFDAVCRASRTFCACALFLCAFSEFSTAVRLFISCNVARADSASFNSFVAFIFSCSAMSEMAFFFFMVSSLVETNEFFSVTDILAKIAISVSSSDLSLLTLAKSSDS
mmetsp:Transcript_20312/g.30292  ORF Transcript_20312/g.30292 Transcript_20312/m.30292 type:complete len:214 (-) Transcript_20312:327-968(-)